jgi:hypothetical protein
VTAPKAPVSPGREQPGTDCTPVPGVPTAQQRRERARLAAELRCEVTIPDLDLPGRYEAKFARGIVRGTAADLRGFFRAG